MDGIESYRYERKFLVTALSYEELNQAVLLHPAIFQPIYQKRYVNNIYFDSPELTSFVDNVEGVGKRTKFRIRWYGPLSGEIQNPVLEIKNKTGFLCSKELYPIERFTIDEDFSIDKVMESVERSKIPKSIVAQLSLLEPVLINRYLRNYFLSVDGDFRITIDRELSFFPFDLSYPKFLNQEMKEPFSILELKYALEKDDEAQKISNAFEFRLTKSSKYVNGVYRLMAE